MGRWAEYQTRLDPQPKQRKVKATHCACGRALTNGGPECTRCHTLEVVKTEDRRVRAPKAGGRRTYCRDCWTYSLGSHDHSNGSGLFAEATKARKDKTVSF